MAKKKTHRKSSKSRTGRRMGAIKGLPTNDLVDYALGVGSAVAATYLFQKLPDSVKEEYKGYIGLGAGVVGLLMAKNNHMIKAVSFGVGAAGALSLAKQQGWLSGVPQIPVYLNRSGNSRVLGNVTPTPGIAGGINPVTGYPTPNAIGRTRTFAGIQ